MFHHFQKNRGWCRLWIRGIACLLIITQSWSCAMLQDLAGKAQHQQASTALSPELIRDKTAIQYINRIADDLVAHIPTNMYRGQLSVLVHVLNTSRIQGLSDFRDRRISITRGVLNVIINESELACFLAHEISHKVLHGRWAQKPVRSLAQSTREEAKFDRKREQDADELGALICNRAGYDPFAFVDLFDRLASFQRKNMFQFFLGAPSSHKDFDQRANHLRKTLRKFHLVRGTKKRYAQRYRQHLKALLSTRTQEGDQDLLEGGIQSPIARVRVLQQQVKAIQARGDVLTVDRFLDVMGELSQIVQRFDLHLERIGSNGRSQAFMQEYLHQDVPLWDHAALKKSMEETLVTLAQVGVGAIPVIGDAVDLYELLSGREFLTGRELSAGERLLTAAGLLVGSGATWRTMAQGLELTLESRVVIRKIGSRERRRARQALDEATTLRARSHDWYVPHTDALNRRARVRGFEPPYKAGRRVLYRTTTKEEVYFRVYRRKPIEIARKDGMQGRWLMRADPRRLSRKELRNWYALPEDPTHVVKVRVPAGTRMRITVAGDNRYGPGGGLQWEILKPDRPNLIFEKPGAL
jgi:hypothetical protein